MNPCRFHTRPIVRAAVLTLGFAIGWCAQPTALRADDAANPGNAAPATQPVYQNIQQEAAAQKQGIHKLSDGSICIKSGPGMAVLAPGLDGCSFGTNDTGTRDPDVNLLAGIFHAFIQHPEEAKNLGFTDDQVTKIKDAYNYQDLANMLPQPVIKLYGEYLYAADGKPKTDALKAVMDKVRNMGQASLDAETKRHKDIKALLTPEQTKQVTAIGNKMLHPFD